MEQTRKQLQSLGICQRLFHFILKTLAAQASKPVTLGGHTQYKQTADLLPSTSPSRCHAFVDDQPLGSMKQMVTPRITSFISITSNIDHDTDNESIIIEEEVNDICVATPGLHETREIEDSNSSSVPRGGAGQKAPKKTVSIKDEVEVMAARKKKKKRKVMGQRQAAEAGTEDGDSKPLKSILRLGLNVK